MRRWRWILVLVTLAGGPAYGVPQRGIGPAPQRPVQPGRVGGVDTGVIVTAESLALAADLRWFCPNIANGELNVAHTPDHREIRAINLLNAGLLNARSPLDRRLAIMGLARTNGNMTQVAEILPKLMLENDDPTVRATAADAIGLSFENAARDPIYGVSVMPPWNAAAFTMRARQLLDARLRVETDNSVSAAILRTMARLPIDVNDAALVESLLAQHLAGNSLRVTGAVAGLEILARRAPKRSFALDTIRRLRDIAEGSVVQLNIDRPPNDPSGAKAFEGHAALRRLALLTLHEANSDHEATLQQAMNDLDWQVRRLAATYTVPRDDASSSALTRLLVDPVFQVRAAALVALAPRMRVELSCASVLTAFDDVSAAVVMTAIDVAPPNCNEKEIVLAWLRQKAASIGGANATWQVPARALAALVRLKDPAARALNAAAATHAVWQVRQQTAMLSEVLKDEVTALALAADSNFNVRAAALKTLTGLESAQRGRLALDTLKAGLSATGPALLAAAAALPATTPVEDARTALDLAFNALFSRAKRDVALGLIVQYRRFAMNDSRALRSALRDQDPLVAEAAAAALAQFSGVSVRADPRLRAPNQLLTFQLRNSPRFATVELSDGGSFRIELLVDEAPVTVAWWTAAWSDAASHDAFIDVAPGVGVSSGGPRDNAIDASDFRRDELGEISHRRGAIALMSNGPDLALNQIFIDLIDRPDLDHGYTVFARIVSGIEAADRILEGVRITRVRFER